MKLLFVAMLLCSSISFAAEVGESMKAECVKIISAERSVEVDTEVESSSEEDVKETVSGQ